MEEIRKKAPVCKANRRPLFLRGGWYRFQPQDDIFIIERIMNIRHTDILHVRMDYPIIQCGVVIAECERIVIVLKCDTIHAE